MTIVAMNKFDIQNISLVLINNSFGIKLNKLFV